MKSPATKKTEALRDLLWTAQYLNRQAAALRSRGYDIEFAVTEDASRVAVFLCSAGASYE